MRRVPRLALLLLVLACSVPAFAGRGPRTSDRFFTAPDFASFGVRSVAMLPAATFDNSLEARKLTEAAFGQAVKGAGYRWVSAIVARDQMLREGGDSLIKATNQYVLKHGFLDTTQARTYGRILRARGLLTLRVDRMERMQLEREQSGKPTTTVEITAALVDSSGRLLWTASGSETAEGPYQDASASALGMRASGLNNDPMTNQGGAPSYAETLTRLFGRWAAVFPAAPADSTH